MTDKSAAPADQAEVFNRILDGLKWEKRLPTGFGGLIDNRLPVQGQFLLTGIHNGPKSRRIGYVVQIRRKQGRFGTDNYLLRHADGTLMQHSDQFFAAATPEEIDAIRPFFGENLPETEDYSHGYDLGSQESRATGFIIEPPAGFQPRGGEGTSMRITQTDLDGRRSTTHVAFI
ncbi:TPA: hypothetical protein ACSPMB_000121 [Pseudomonas aeruginosa]